MTELFDWFRPGHELLKMNFEWNIQLSSLQSALRNDGHLLLSPFFPHESSDNQWQLSLYNGDTTNMLISALHFNSAGERVDVVDPVLVKISVLNRKEEEILQQTKPSELDSDFVSFLLAKRNVFRSECQQADGSYTFCCKILSHVKKESVSSADPNGIAINCLNGLSTHFQGLYDNMQYSDVHFNIRGREFPAHKIVLVTRSQVFAAMFQHPTKEQLSNRITIEDIDPEVFKELLRFIYTGRVFLAKMEAMAVGLLIAADKYLLDELKSECENYLFRQMSPVNCFEILFNADLLLQAEQLKNEAANFFWRHRNQVMETNQWKKFKEENRDGLRKIYKLVFSHVLKIF